MDYLKLSIPNLLQFEFDEPNAVILRDNGNSKVPLIAIEKITTANSGFKKLGFREFKVCFFDFRCFLIESFRLTNPNLLKPQNVVRK
jgi:hypothetical protein